MTHHQTPVAICRYQSDSRYLIPVYASERLAIYSYCLLLRPQLRLDPFTKHTLESVDVQALEYLV